MSIRYSNLIILSLIMMALLILSATLVCAQHYPVWPIAQNEDPDHWDRVNCTFGERHSDHFHAGIDIDCDDGVHARAAQPGQRRRAYFDIPGFQGVGIEIDHEYPPNSGILDNRKTRYLHLNKDTLIPINQWVGTGGTVGTINSNDGHLQFDMWQYDEQLDDWYMLNPLQNDAGWQVGSPPDVKNPEINNVLLQPMDTLGVFSGYTAPLPPNDAITKYDGKVKIHFRPRPTSNEAIYNPDVNKLVVFGSIGPIVNTRDVEITDKGGDVGDGLTVYATKYGVADEHQTVHETYQVKFDRIPEGESGELGEIFHTNSLYGNNDFIELRDTNDIFLYPHKTMTVNNLHSNGIWYTKARKTDPPVYMFDHAHLPEIAAITDEALFPDGKYTLPFHVEDAAGRLDRAQNKAEDNAQVETIVDNFRPYVKRIGIQAGIFRVYSSQWTWTRNGNDPGTLALTPANDRQKGAIDPNQPLQITVATSESMRFTTNAQGQIEQGVQLKMQTKNATTPWLDWTDPQTVSADRTTWNFFIPSSVFPTLTTGFEGYTQILSIRGNDLAGNRLIEYDGSVVSYTEAQIPARTGNAPPNDWTTDPSFANRSGIDITHRFVFGNYSTPLTFAAAYGGADDDTAQSMQPTVQYQDGMGRADGFVLAGWTQSFDANQTDVWAIKLKRTGGIAWQQRYGGNGDDWAYAVQQTYRYEDGVKQNDGYIVAGSTTSFGGGKHDLLLLKLSDAGAVEWAKVYGGAEDDVAYAIQQTYQYVNGVRQDAYDGYIVAGWTTSFDDNADFWVLRLDPNGAITWQAAYGRILAYQHDWAYAVQQTGDGNFLVGGKSRPYPSGLSEFCVVKLQPDGQVIWRQEFRDPQNSQSGGMTGIQEIPETADGKKYLVVGNYGDHAAIFPLFTSGAFAPAGAVSYPGVGFRSYSGVFRGYTGLGNDRPAMFYAAGAQEYLVAGRRTAPEAAGDIWISNVDQPHANSWQTTYGGSGVDESAVAWKTADNGMAVAGTTTFAETNQSEMLLLKLNQQGCFPGYSTCLTKPAAPAITPTPLTLTPRTTTFDAKATTITPVDVTTSFQNTSTAGSVLPICGDPVQPQLLVKQGWTTIPDGDPTVRYEFGAVPQGAQTTIPFVIENTGLADVEVERVDVAGSNQFSVDPALFPLTIAEGNHAMLPVTFSPAAPLATQTGQVALKRPNPDDPAQPLPLYTFFVRGNRVYALKVVKGGTGEGTVTGVGDSPINNDNITCGTDCQGNYLQESAVTLQALPNLSSVLTGWLINDRPMGLSDAQGNFALTMLENITTVTAEFTRKQYIIAGQVFDTNGGIRGATISGVPNPATTDANGFYSAAVNYGWTGTVTPLHLFYAFRPLSTSYNNITSDQLFQNYSAGLVPVVGISGNVYDQQGQGLGGVFMAGLVGLEETPITDSNGWYATEVPVGWSGEVTPQLEGYTFPTRTYTNVTTVQTGQNYTGTSTSPTPTPTPTPTNTFTPTPTPTMTYTPTPTPTATYTPTPTPTPTYTPTPTPTATYTPTPTPTYTPTPTPTPTRTPTPTPTPNWTPTPTPTPITIPLPYVSYLAEGYTNSGFQTEIVLFNPNAQEAVVQVTFLKENEQPPVLCQFALPAMSRQIIDAGEFAPNQGFATQVESNVWLAVERSMYWPAGGVTDAGGSNSAAASELSTTWYFAEGYNSINNPNTGFKTYLLLLNPHPTSVSVAVTFLNDDGTNLIYTREMPALSRQTVETFVATLIPNGGFAMQVDATMPIMAERSMYWASGGVDGAGGHATIGAAQPAATWYLAEGYNSSAFRTNIVLLNPNATATTANVTFLKEDGTTLSSTPTLPARSRWTINTKDADLIPSGGFATTVTADQPIVVERAMSWSAGGAADADGHVTIGATQPSTTWYFADGDTRNSFNTNIMLLNPTATDGQATVTFLKDDGTTVNYPVTLPANSRKTVIAKAVAPDDGFGSTLAATVPIMAERAMYWSAGGVANAGGHASLGLTPPDSAASMFLLWTK